MASVYLFKRFKDVDLLDLMYMETVLASGEYTLQTPLRPPTDTVRWFQGQVASAFAKLAARDQDAASNILTLYEEIFYKVTAKDNE